MGIVTDSDLNRIGSSPFSDKPTCKLTCTKASQGELKGPYPAKTHFEAPPGSESFQGGYRNQLSHQSCQLVLSTPICSLARSPLHSFSPALLLHFVAAETCFMFSDGSCMFSCCCCCCCCWTSIYTIYAVITHQENSLTSCTWISLKLPGNKHLQWLPCQQMDLEGFLPTSPKLTELQRRSVCAFPCFRQLLFERCFCTWSGFHQHQPFP